MQPHDYYKVPMISNSFLSNYKRQLNGMAPLANKHSLLFGGGFHTLLLEPEKFDRTLYTGKDRMQIMDMVKSVKDNLPPEVFEGKKEHEFYYTQLGFKCKAKMDIVNSVCGDFKTTGYSNAQDFLQSVVDYDYQRQAAWYLDVPAIVRKGIDQFVIWGVSKVKPYPVFVYELQRDHPLIEVGREEYKYLIETFSTTPEAKQYLSSQLVA